MLQRIKNTLIYLFVRGLQLSTRLFPRVWLVALGGWLGRSFHDWVPHERKKALDHLEQALPGLPPAERARLARRVFQRMGENALEFMKMTTYTGRRVSALVEEVIGREHMEAARARGRGVICLTAHLGNWEILPVYMLQQGWPTAVVAQELYDPRLDRLLNQFRERCQVMVIKRGNLTRQIIRCLHENFLLGVLNDQDTDVDSRFAPFFGIPAQTPVGIFRLVRRTGAAVVPVFIVRTPSGRHRIHIEPLLSLPVTDDEEADLLTGARLCNQVTEAIIRRYPEQWVWFHQRWKHQPVAEGTAHA